MRVPLGATVPGPQGKRRSHGAARASAAAAAARRRWGRRGGRGRGPRARPGRRPPSRHCAPEGGVPREGAVQHHQGKGRGRPTSHPTSGLARPLGAAGGPTRGPTRCPSGARAPRPHSPPPDGGLPPPPPSVLPCGSVRTPQQALRLRVIENYFCCAVDPAPPLTSLPGGGAPLVSPPNPQFPASQAAGGGVPAGAGADAPAGARPPPRAAAGPRPRRPGRRHHLRRHPLHRLRVRGPCPLRAGGLTEVVASLLGGGAGVLRRSAASASCAQGPVVVRISAQIVG